MAFPTIQTADTKNGVQTSNSTSWTGLTYPTNLVSGDLILAFVAWDGQAQSTWPTDWTRSQEIGAGAVGGAIGYKISNGTETGTFTLTLNNSEQGSWRIFRITGWFGSGVPDNQNSFVASADGAAAAGAGITADANPNPPSLDPGNWATEDTLWFAVCMVDTSRTISVYPLADNNTADVSGGAGGATLGVCTTNSAVSSLDPGTFTISTSDDWRTVTVAVRPAAAADPLPSKPLIKQFAVTRSYTY